MQQLRKQWRRLTPEFIVGDAQVKVARSSLTKVSIQYHSLILALTAYIIHHGQLKRLAKSLHHSPMDSIDLEDACKQADIKPKKMSRSVPTRWNSVAEASGCAIELKDALKVLWDMPKHSHRNAKLRKYKLTPAEWTILEQLHGLLKVRYDPFIYAKINNRHLSIS